MSYGESIENRKRKIHAGEERLHRNRERNRMHARKTRERKKNQSNALQIRLDELQKEGTRLRQIVDERYTASVLLGLSQTFKDSSGENHTVLSAASICENAFCKADNSFLGEVNTVGGDKRKRRRGKCTSQERERIRRERNRVHAKKTRDRKKELLEISEGLIIKMEKESFLLREYLVSLRLLSVEEAKRLEVRAKESGEELAALKDNLLYLHPHGDDEDEDLYDENIDCDDPNEPDGDPDGSLSGSDELDKEGSCDGSLEGETSSDGNASTSSKASSSSNSGSSSSGTDSAGDSAVLTSTDTEICKKIHYKNRNNTINPIENKSQSCESYSHGGLNMDFKEISDVEKYDPISDRPISSNFLSQSSLLPSNFNNNDFILDNNDKTDSNKRNNNYNVNKDNNYNEKKIDFLVQKSTFKKSLSSSNMNVIETATSNSLSKNPKGIVDKAPKISNIIIPLIPQGVLPPREPGGVSPQGMKSVISSSQEELSNQKLLKINNNLEIELLKFEHVHKFYPYNCQNGDVIYRYFPSSCPSSASCEAL